MSKFTAPFNPFSGLPGQRARYVPEWRPPGPNTSGGFLTPGSKAQIPGHTEFDAPNYLEQLFGASAADLGSQKKAADAQKTRLDSVIKGTEGTLKDFSKTYQQGISTSLSSLDGLLGDIKGLGAQQSRDFEAGASSVMDAANKGADSVLAGANGVGSMVQSAIKTADSAVGKSEAAWRGYDQGVTENAIGATITGLREHVQQQKQMIAAGLNPDGTMMSPAERMQASRELEADTNRTVAMTAGGLREQAQKTLADLKNVTAGLQMGAAGVRVQGASLLEGANAQRLGAEQLRANVGTTISGQRLQSQAGQRELAQLSVGVQQFMSQLRTGAQLAGFQAQMAGQNSLYEQIQSNPESVISLLPTLLLMGQVASSPGGRGMAGFNFQ